MERLTTETIEDLVSYDVLTYQADFLIERLFNNATVESLQEGRQLFMELKRWMFLVHTYKSKTWDMYSFRIDETWHQFILYTEEYTKFCNNYFGFYFSHYPGNAPGINETNQSKAATLVDFAQLYEETFKITLPDVWYDEKSININRRVINDDAGQIKIKEEKGMFDMINAAGETLLSVNYFAKDAIAFVAATKAFYVRELPGGLTNNEKISLINCLVSYKILRVTS